MFSIPEKNGCPNKGNVEDTANSDSLGWYSPYCSLSLLRSGWRIRELINIRSMSCSVSNTTDAAESPADVCPTPPFKTALAVLEPLCSPPSAHLSACTRSSTCSVQSGAVQAGWSVSCGVRLGKRLIISASPSLLWEEIEHSSRNRALIGIPFFQLCWNWLKLYTPTISLPIAPRLYPLCNSTKELKNCIEGIETCLLS